MIGAKILEYIGHKISDDGIKELHPDDAEKIRHAISDQRTRKKLKRSLHGLTGYYREFIPNYAAKA